jgi:hypothetical protein
MLSSLFRFGDDAFRGRCAPGTQCQLDRFGRQKALSALKGQPVVLLIAPTLETVHSVRSSDN